MIQIYLLYIIAFFITVLLLFKLYLKIAHPFWHIQPVYHFYDFHYLFYPPSIIDKNLPYVNKYVNIIDIKTLDVKNIKKDDLISLSNFLKKHYLNSKNVVYYPEVNHIFTPFTSNYDPSYISTYKNGINNYKGMISARPLNIMLKNNIKFKIYYVDNLCVHSMYRKQGIAQQLIQTIYYNLRHQNKNILCCLFKREGNLTAITPLVLYKSLFYEITQNLYQKNMSYEIINVNKDNIQYFYSFIKEHRGRFDTFIYPDISNILSSIQNDYYQFYMLKNGNHIFSIYGFRNSNTFYKSQLIVECFFSLFNDSIIDSETFIWGFYESLSIFNKNIVAKYILLENIGDNDVISNKLKFNLISTSNNAYFLYNFINKPISHKNIMLII